MSANNASAAAVSATAHLGPAAARGALVTMGGQACKLLLQFGGIVILARLLSPGDYGLLAMVTAIVGIADVLRDFGLSSAMVQARSVSPQQRSNLFWINTAIGLVLAGAVFAAAPAIAAFYVEPRLVPVARALALTFLLSGLATQFRAHLSRDMRFGAIAAVEVSAQAVALGVGVMLASQGNGHWALVGLQLTQAATVLTMLVFASDWRPGLPRRNADMGRFLRYGGNLVGTQLIGYVSRNLDALIIGHRFGAELLGLYNRAYQLLMLPLNQINMPATSIALPVLSRLRDDPQRYERFLVQGQAVILHVVVAVFAFAGAQAEPLIVLVLGKQWAPAVPIFQVLAFAGVFQGASSSSYWVFLSKGLTGSNLRFTLVSRVVVIGGILLGSEWGVRGIAVALSTGAVLSWLWGLAWLRSSGAPVGAMFANALRIMIAYGLCALASVTASTLLAQGLPERLAVGAGAMAITFLIVVALWPWFRRNVAAILRGRALLRDGRTAAAAPVSDPATTLSE